MTLNYRDYINKPMTREEFENLCHEIYTQKYMIDCNYSFTRNDNVQNDDDFAETIINICGREGRILIGGCGCGGVVEKLKSKGVEVFGFDISSAIEDEVHVSPKIRRFVKRGSCYQIPFTDHFDYYVTADVLEHIPFNLLKDCAEEIKRFQFKKMIHVIGTAYPDDGNDGNIGHITFQEYKWWASLFEDYVDVSEKYKNPRIWKRTFKVGVNPGAIVYERKDLIKKDENADLV